MVRLGALKAHQDAVKIYNFNSSMVRLGAVLDVGGATEIRSVNSSIVVTSYSIHYTKLYEVPPAWNAGWKPRKRAFEWKSGMHA